MQNMPRLAAMLAALSVTIACSDSRSVTAPSIPTSVSTEITSASVCQAQLNDVREAIDTAAFDGKNADRERTNLLGKLDAAEAELAAGKTVDAVQKLRDIQVSVGRLSTPVNGKTKLDPADAAVISTAVDAAVVCIEPLAIPG